MPKADLTFSTGALPAEQIAALIADGTRAVKEVNPEARVWLVVEEVRGGSWGVEGEVARLLPKPAPAA